MEYHWLPLTILWITVPSTLSICWIFMKFLEKTTYRFWGKQKKADKNLEITEMGTSTDSTSCSKHSVFPTPSKNVVRKINLITRLNDSEETFTSLTPEVTSIHKTPPDIYITNVRLN